ncbi:MAG: UDP-N-acetylmuramoyl-tripeptide--D-alanyl-D-alanine ligase [Chthoniobacterales bacterium]
MTPTLLSQIATWCGGQLRGDDCLVSGISKDTRTLTADDLYVGIRGEQFDGNSFVPQAAAAGAVAAIVDSDDIPALPENFGVIRVQDSIRALHQLSVAVRAQMNIKAVCITGSNGKTSTKDFAAKVLSSRFRTLSTPGNFNNHIGLPFTIVNADQDAEVAVWEIGMSHPGEIEPLARLVRPDIGIVTNIGIAHIEYMHSQDAIAKEKGMLLEVLEPAGLAILNAQDNFTASLAKRTQARVLQVGIDSGDIRATNLSQTIEGCTFTVETPSGTAQAKIAIPGTHMVLNSLFAIAAGMDLGISLEECLAALANAKLTSGRLEKKTIRGILFLDDTYNANPDSMEAALTTLAGMTTKGRKIAALGRMGELGSHAESGYRRVGKVAAASVDTLITVGKETSPLAEAARSQGLKQVIEMADTAEATHWLQDFARQDDVVLVKGSRSAKMEHVIGGFK